MRQKKTDTEAKKQNFSRKTETPDAGAPRPSLTEGQRRELWLYIGVSIVAVEFLVAVGAVFYGFITPGAQAAGGFSFPWLSWGAVSVIAPTLILLLVHFADVGLFRPPSESNSETEWQERLPERMRRIYGIIKGAPVVVVLLGIILLGFALMTLEGALSALSRFGTVLIPYIPHIVGAVVILAAVFTGASAWLSYRTRKLMAEYEFRRQVLEQTGVIIVDKGSSALPAGGTGEMPLAITAGEEAALQALPAAAEARVITAEARELEAVEPEKSVAVDDDDPEKKN